MSSDTESVWQARAKHVAWVLVVDGGDVTLVDTGYPGDRDRVITSLAKVGRSPADVAAVVTLVVTVAVPMVPADAASAATTSAILVAQPPHHHRPPLRRH